MIRILRWLRRDEPVSRRARLFRRQLGERIVIPLNRLTATNGDTIIITIKEVTWDQQYQEEIVFSVEPDTVPIWRATKTTKKRAWFQCVG